MRSNLCPKVFIWEVYQISIHQLGSSVGTKEIILSSEFPNKSIEIYMANKESNLPTLTGNEIQISETTNPQGFPMTLFLLLSTQMISNVPSVSNSTLINAIPQTPLSNKELQGMPLYLQQIMIWMSQIM